MTELVTLDRETHTYYDVNGHIVPGVTTVIDHLADYMGIPQETLDHKSRIGTAVHRAAELLDNDDLELASVDPRIVGYLEAWIKFKTDTGAVILENEMQLYHPLYRYAGTLDRVLMLGDEVGVYDLKCTATINRRYVGPQLAGYDLALMRYHPLPWTGPGSGRHRRYAVQLKPDGKYMLHSFPNYSGDEQAFLSSLYLYNWKRSYDKTA